MMIVNAELVVALMEFAEAIVEAEWSAEQGHFEDAGCPFCDANAIHDGEHKAGCVVIEARKYLKAKEQYDKR